MKRLVLWLLWTLTFVFKLKLVKRFRSFASLKGLQGGLLEALQDGFLAGLLERLLECVF